MTPRALSPGKSGARVTKRLGFNCAYSCFYITPCSEVPGGLVGCACTVSLLFQGLDLREDV